MPLLARLATSAAIVVLMLLAPAVGEESVEVESQALAFAGLEQSDDILLEQQMLSPSIDITGDAFVSNRATTNWALDTELLVFQPKSKFSFVTFNDADGNSKLAAGLRFTLEWESDEGYGIRARLSGIGAEGTASGIRTVSSFVTPGNPFRASSVSDEPFEVSAGQFDIDLFKRFEGDSADVVMGLGLASAALRSEIPQSLQNTISGGGISMFSELRQVIYRSDSVEWAVVGGGRFSFLDGEWESKIPGDMIEGDTDMAISEGSLGMEWSRNLNGRILSLRAQYEYQQWDSEDTTQISFNGAALRAGISW